MAAQKKVKLGSTQKFTGILDIAEQIVLLEGNNACLVIEIQASNFALLSQEEQQAKIYSYASFLNSLSFPIQIVVRNKKIDISSYINLLNQQSKNTTTLHANLTEQQNQALITYIHMYRDFIQDLIKINSVLDKKFYIIINYSYLEQGVVSAKGGDMASFITAASASLKTKAESVLSQLSRLSLRARILEKEELVKLFYDIYNPNNPVSRSISDSMKAPVITAQQSA